MTIHDAVKFAWEIAQWPAAQQDEFFLATREILTEEGYTALQYLVGYCHLTQNPDLAQAVKQAMAEEMYRYFNSEKGETK